MYFISLFKSSQQLRKVQIARFVAGNSKETRVVAPAVWTRRALGTSTCISGMSGGKKISGIG